MKLYLVKQRERDGYDTYDSFVIAAENEESARRTGPDGSVWQTGDWSALGHSWASSPDKVTVQYLGEADSALTYEVICASFNAG